MKKIKPILIGLVAGTLSTYPVSLSFLPSIILWGFAGLLVGLLLSKDEKVVLPGILYGISLTVVFLFGRFGGARDKILPYTLLVAGFSIVGALSGILAVFVGSKIKNIFGKENSTPLY